MSQRDPASLHLQETAAAPPAIEGDGTVKLQLIRPCVGRGKGRHVYEADMLAKNAHKFGGWPMYVDHETEGERKARGGLPRSVKDIGGIVLESHWDPSVPAEGRFGAGAVVGTVRPIKQVGDLVELHPSLVESSINARATGVKPVMREGARAWLVEGIEDKGSVDWVTEGGAGGKVVAALLESIDTSREDQEAELFESLTDEELREHLSKTRPGVLVEATPAKAKGKSDGDAEDDGPGGDGGADEDVEALAAQMVKKGMPEALAMKAAKRQIAAKSAKEAAEPVVPVAPVTPRVPPTNEGAAVADVTREQIEEAVLQSPEVATLIKDMVEQGIEKQLSEATTRIRAEAYADAERQIELRDLRDAAHKQIRESRLPEQFARRAMAEFDVTRDGPTFALDVFESYDDDGNVVKSAEEVLHEVVEAVIQDQRELVGSLSKTRVRGQGSATGDGDASGEPTKRDTVGPLTRALAVQEAHIDPDKAFGGALAIQG